MAAGVATVGLEWNSPSSELSSHSRTVLDVDWKSTSLGVPSTWPSQLHRVLSYVMKDPNPMAVFWGEDLILIYNEAFVDFAGAKHPKSMGASVKAAYSEVWDSFQGIIDRGRSEGKSTRHTDVCLFLKRHGYQEECYVTYTFVPTLGDDGTVTCFLHTVTEVTQQILTARRTSTLLAIGDCTSTATNMKDFWARTLAAFEPNAQDAPFVLVYSFDDLSDSDSASAFSDGSNQTSLGSLRTASLEGTIGLPMSQAPMQLDTKDEQDNFVISVKKALRSEEAVIIKKGDFTLPSWLSTKVNGRGFDDECNAAAILPIRPVALNDTDGTNVVGFLVLGLNPRRPYDTDYQRFLHLWLRQLATSAASVTLIEQQNRRQMQLSEQLKIQRQKAQEVEARLIRFAEITPVAMWIVKPMGELIYANRAWHEMVRGYYDEVDPVSHWSALAEQDNDRIHKEWASIVDGKKPAALETRLKGNRSLTDPLTGDEVAAPYWVLATAHPEMDEDGVVVAIHGCSIDISHQKWTEGLREQRLKDVLEMKRQSENFIDMTSHEMRNPLSAILHSAEGITMSLDEARQLSSPESSSVVLDGPSLECITDSADVITICAQHQKRIIDDILTLSKLDASLLVLTPDRVRPTDIIRHTLKIFELEMRSAKITCSLQVEDSYAELNVDWVLLDQCRLIQVLINLTTNAIKFTRNENPRVIIVSISASKHDPKLEKGTTDYFELDGERPDPTLGLEWGSGECIFLKLAVQDTGKGLSPEEQARLFSKFSQASHRTHIEYGVSAWVSYGISLSIFFRITKIYVGIRSGSFYLQGTYRIAWRSNRGFFRTWRWKQVLFLRQSPQSGRLGTLDSSRVCSRELFCTGYASPRDRQDSIVKPNRRVSPTQTYSCPHCRGQSYQPTSLRAPAS